jgi:hypothetical protein
MAALSLLVLAIFAGLAYQAAGAWRDARRFSPRGRLIDIAPHPTAQTMRGGGPGGYRLHAHVSGEGEPAVVLEAGIAASSLSWSLVQPEVARFGRVCSYDRGGLAWSDPHRSRRTCAAIVEELRALLVAAPLPPPNE